MQFTRESADSADLRTLAAELDAELLERYGADQAQFTPHNALASLDAVVIARTDASLVGCGAFRRHDAESVEVKRMFVRRTHRGSGAAAGVLAELERWARELGFTRCVLETGVRQPDALRFYAKMGYTRVDAFPPYVGNTLSVCLGRAIA